MRVGLTTQRLVEAGADLADESGLAEVTVSALARRFGVRAASVYAHVTSAHDLMTRIALLALDELADQVGEALAGRAGDDALRSLAGAHREYARLHPGRWAAAKLPLDDAAAGSGPGARHAALNRAVLRGYDLGEPDQTHAVRLIGSVVRGFVDLELAGAFSHSEPASEESWGRALDALDATLRSWAAGPT